jgi:hypothetical protein
VGVAQNLARLEEKLERVESLRSESQKRFCQKRFCQKSFSSLLLRPNLRSMNVLASEESSHGQKVNGHLWQVVTLGGGDNYVKTRHEEGEPLRSQAP